MKIIEIRNTQYGEVAYILDGSRVMKVMVEDHTMNKYPELEVETEEIEYEEPRPRRRVMKAPRMKAVPQDDGPREININDIPDEMLDRRSPIGEKPNLTNVTKVRRPNIIPPNLAGVFRKPGEPGAATETRMV